MYVCLKHNQAVSFRIKFYNNCDFNLAIYYILPTILTYTLEYGISVASGTFGKKNKHSPLKKHIPLHQITEFRTFFYGKKPKINKRTPMFIPESRVGYSLYF